MKRVPFSAVPVGTEFMWGAWDEKDMNWGYKRTTRTADYRPRLSGNLTDGKYIAYWKQNETVYLASWRTDH